MYILYGVGNASFYLLILSDESGRLFYSTSNGYNKWAPDRFLALSAFVGI